MEFYWFFLGFFVAFALLIWLRGKRKRTLQAALMQVSLKVAKLHRMSSCGASARSQHRGALVALSMAAAEMGHEKLHETLHELWKQAWDTKVITSLPGSELSFVPDIDTVALPVVRLAAWARRWMSRRPNMESDEGPYQLAAYDAILDGALEGEGPAARYFQHLFTIVVPEELEGR